MTLTGWVQILLFALVIFAVTKPIGIYMFRIFEGDRQPLPRFFGPIERLIYRLCGVDPQGATRLEAVQRCDAALQRHHVARDLRHRAIATCATVKSREARSCSSGSRLRHGFELHHQYELAGLRRRIDDELSDADGGARLAQLHLGRRRHRRHVGDRARLDLSACSPVRQERSAIFGST